MGSGTEAFSKASLGAALEATLVFLKVHRGEILQRPPKEEVWGRCLEEKGLKLPKPPGLWGLLAFTPLHNFSGINCRVLQSVADAPSGEPRFSTVCGTWTVPSQYELSSSFLLVHAQFREEATRPPAVRGLSSAGLLTPGSHWCGLEEPPSVQTAGDPQKGPPTALQSDSIACRLASGDLELGSTRFRKRIYHNCCCWALCSSETHVHY